MASTAPSVLLQPGQDVEAFVAVGDLEADASGAVVLEDQQAVAQDVVDEVRGLVVEHHQIDPAAEALFEVAGQGELEAGQAWVDRLALERGQVHVAVRAVVAAGHAAEQVDGCRVLAPGRETMGDFLCQAVSIHGAASTLDLSWILGRGGGGALDLRFHSLQRRPVPTDLLTLKRSLS